MPGRILFLVNGLGLGNATRCHAVLQRLAGTGVEIDVATSGNGIWYFRDRPEPARLVELRSLYYGAGPDGRLSMRRTMAALPDFLRIQRHNAAVLEDHLDLRRPDLAVVDSVYSLGPLRRRGIPVAALNNADVVHVGYRRLGPAPRSVRAQFRLVEEPDYWFHRCRLDRVFSPCLDPTLPEVGPPFVRVGPVVRAGYDPAPTDGPPRRVLVMLSGSRFGSPVLLRRVPPGIRIDVVGREAPADGAPEGVVHHGRVRDTRGLARAADLAVVNGGFSAVSEMFRMRKPLIVIPVPNHAEQWVNAASIAALGVGTIGSEDDLDQALDQALARIDGFRRAYAALPAAQDGAAAMAEGLLDMLRGAL